VGLNYDSSPGGLSGCSGNIFYGNRVGGLETLQFYYIAFWIEGNSDNNIIGGVEPGQANDLSYSSNGLSVDGNGNQVSTSKQHYVQMATQALCPGIYIINIESRHQLLTHKWLKTSDY
jgi:hypothetical protein